MKKAKYFYESIFPSIFISMIWGICPIFISNRGNERVLYRNKYLYAINIAYLVVFSSLIVHIVSEAKGGVMSNNYYKSNKISNIGIAFIFSGGILYVYIIYICGLLKAKSIKKTVERFSKIDKTLEKFGQDLQYTKSIVYQVVSQLATLILISIITAMQHENIHKEHFRELSTATWIIFIFPAITVNFFENQLVYTILLIRQRFSMVNQQLQKVGNQIVSARSNIKVVSVTNFEGTTTNVKVSVILEKISILMKMHDELGDIATVVSENYTTQEVVVLLFQYGILLFSVFYSYWMFTLKPFSAICWIMWSTLKTSEVLHVTISCHLTSKQSKLTGPIIHKILIRSCPEQIRNKLMIFSNQLLHRKVSFKIWGILTLDATLLYTMISAAATYMVIMLQFQQASLPMMCKTNASVNVTATTSTN